MLAWEPTLDPHNRSTHDVPLLTAEVRDTDAVALWAAALAAFGLLIEGAGALLR